MVKKKKNWSHSKTSDAATVIGIFHVSLTYSNKINISGRPKRNWGVYSAFICRSNAEKKRASLLDRLKFRQKQSSNNEAMTQSQKSDTDLSNYPLFLISPLSPWLLNTNNSSPLQGSGSCISARSNTQHTTFPPLARNNVLGILHGAPEWSSGRDNGPC